MARVLARRVIPVCLAGVLTASGFAVQNPPNTVEELIAEKPASCAAIDEEDVASADGLKVAWRCRTDGKWAVFVNGVPQGGTFDDVRALIFTPDGRHVTFTGRRGKRWMVVVDGKERPETYADIGLPIYTSDGKRMAFAAKAEKKWTLVVDGTPLKAEFDDIVTRTFSPDGSRAAYVGRRGNKFVVVVDGKERPPADVVSAIRFSADGRRFAYANANVDRGFGRQKALGRVTIDEGVGPTHEGAQVGSLMRSMATGSSPQIVTGYVAAFWSDTHGVGTPLFSPDGIRVAYAARRGKEDAVVILDGEAGPPFASIVAGPVFSPDSRHLAFAVVDAGGLALVVDGKTIGRGPLAGTDFIRDLTFAPDNTRLAYIGVTGGNLWDQGMTARARRRVYVDGIAGAEYDVPYLGGLRFSRDGKHLVYVVGGFADQSRTVAFVVANGSEGKRYDGIFGAPRFDEGERAVRYTAQLGRSFYAVRTLVEDTVSR